MTINRRLFLSVMVGGFAASLTRASAANAAMPQPTEITVFRSPTCGCCRDWVDHMQASGFQVQDNVTDAMASVKQRYGVPEAAESCHTAIIDGYVVEGHVPASDVQRLLAERPNVRGIAAPGMPVGSPGMEMGDRRDPYTVVSFTRSGAIATFAEHS